MPKSSKKTSVSQTFSSSVLEETNKSLQKIAASLGFIVLQMSPLKDGKNPKKIHFLSKFGFDRNQIAAILDSTPNTISKELSILKSSSGKEGAVTYKSNG